MNRRQFISNSLSIVAGAALLMDFPILAKVLKEKGTPNLKIGIISDIHITTMETTGTFRHALEYFREKKVDGVLIAGDMADNGFEKQLKVVADVWFSVFPDNKLPDGQRVEPLFICGNHDAEISEGHRKQFPSDTAFEKEAMGYHLAESWMNCFREEFAPIYMKTVKGYNFIGVHWQYPHVDGLAEFLGSHHSVLSGTKPFFYFQHPHPRNTCNKPWVWDQDDGTTTEILSHYPNCIAFSGHSHCTLTDERDLWQGGFTSIGTGAMSYLCLMGARENSANDSDESEVKNLNTGNGRQGMVMNVYDDCISIEKRDFVYDEPLRENWVIPLNVEGTPLSFENRAKTALIPQFNLDDKVYITRGMGSRNGDDHKQVIVHFPSVLKKTHGVRAFDYEVKVEARYWDVIKGDETKHVYSPGCYLGESKDGGEVTCVFAESQLPANYQVRFAVRPCECFGGKGNPIYSEWVPSRT